MEVLDLNSENEAEKKGIADDIYLNNNADTGLAAPLLEPSHNERVMRSEDSNKEESKYVVIDIVQQSHEEEAVPIKRCCSCFSFFFPSGSRFNLFHIFGKKREENSQKPSSAEEPCMSNHLRFIVSYGGQFVNVNDEWKWRGDKTTSILVPTSITITELVIRLKDKLGILDHRTQIELKFKVPNLNIPPVEIREDEDLKLYISVQNETAICVTVLEAELPSVGMGMNTNCSNHSFDVAKFHQNVPQDELNHQHSVGEGNPGTITHIEVDSHNRSHYFFLAFGASIRGYIQYLRPVICVDGSHLKGPYEGNLLLTTTQDSNKQIYPLAWEIVDAEINKSWMWFLSNLKNLIGDSDELVFVSNRKTSIEKVIYHLFPLSHHGYCMWHMEKNLIQRYNNASSIFLFKRVVTTYRIEEFERLMSQIRMVNAISYGYLERASFSFWSRALFGGQRYNIMTNNNAESLNSMLRHARSLPIMCLVEHIRSTMQRWFFGRRTHATARSTVLSSRIESELRTTFEVGTRLRAHALIDSLTKVGKSNDMNMVDFSKNMYTCREFQLNRMPIVHATRATCFRGTSLYDLCSPYYIFEYWRGAYSEAIYPISREVGWVVPNEITSTSILLPVVRRPPGKPPIQGK